MGKDCDSVLKIHKSYDILYVWAGLVLHLGYILEKVAQIKHKIPI